MARMLENTDQKNSEYGFFSRNEYWEELYKIRGGSLSFLRETFRVNSTFSGKGTVSL